MLCSNCGTWYAMRKDNLCVRCHAIKIAKEFDEAMEKVKSITAFNQEDIDRLMENAKVLAETTTLSMGQALDVVYQKELTKEKV